MVGKTLVEVNRNKRDFDDDDDDNGGEEEESISCHCRHPHHVSKVGAEVVVFCH